MPNLDHWPSRDSSSPLVAHWESNSDLRCLLPRSIHCRTGRSSMSKIFFAGRCQTTCRPAMMVSLAISPLGLALSCSCKLRSAVCGSSPSCLAVGCCMSRRSSLSLAHLPWQTRGRHSRVNPPPRMYLVPRFHSFAGNIQPCSCSCTMQAPVELAAGLPRSVPRGSLGVGKVLYPVWSDFSQTFLPCPALPMARPPMLPR
ncbi:hypothetical protein B0T16DRAFT_84484 [Cercophora newfieldiana]|uniref:Uncharacterized protein n=1 Tax=Cercophora newfieldiana TaxID=92897 RepID=A0AA39YFH0_9PEZI|nr:hypothetical protein B0T16DRAFT_84484 [Cercophora newfieldiana]